MGKSAMIYNGSYYTSKRLLRSRIAACGFRDDNLLSVFAVSGADDALCARQDAQA